MFRLLALVATALAAPQYPYYPQYVGYSNMGLYGLPIRQFYQPATYIPVVEGIPVVQAGLPPASTVPVLDRAMNQNTRSIIKFQNFQEINGNFAAHDTANPAGTTTTQEIVGTVQITQNPLTNLLNGNDASFKINIQSSGNPAVAGNGARVILAFASAAQGCMTPVPATPAANRFAELAVGPLPFISGRTTGFNIDGMNSKTSLRGMRLQILNAAGTAILGCSNELF